VAQGTTAQNIALQQEFVRPELEALTLFSATLWKRIEERTDVKETSGRPARIPFEVQLGNKARVGNLDGQGLGRGSAPTMTFGNLSSVCVIQATEYTKLSELSTDSSQKAIENYVSRVNQEATETFAGYWDALLCNSSGANQLDTIVSTATGQYFVNNANGFQDNQDIDVWTAVGGAFLGTVTIQSVDTSTNSLWLTGPIAPGSAAGNVLLFNGSSGAANSGVFGVPYYQVAGNAGNYMGISRSTWGGKFSTPFLGTVGALTPATIRALEAQIKQAIGVEEAAKSDICFHANTDVQTAWEQNYLQVQVAVANQIKGDYSEDMLKKQAPKEIAGRELIVNVRAIPGRLDALGLKHWFRIQTTPVDYYEIGGQTLFPVYGIDGGLVSSAIFYLQSLMQFGNGQPRRGAYATGITIPAGQLGK
jgi:hypothetical protein